MYYFLDHVLSDFYIWSHLIILTTLWGNYLHFTDDNKVFTTKYLTGLFHFAEQNDYIYIYIWTHAHTYTVLKKQMLIINS